MRVGGVWQGAGDCSTTTPSLKTSSILCSMQWVHCVNPLRMDTSNLSFTTKSCMHAYITFLAGTISCTVKSSADMCYTYKTTGFIMQHICACTTINNTIQQVKRLHEERYTKQNKERVSRDIKQSVRTEKKRQRRLSNRTTSCDENTSKDDKTMILLRPKKAVSRMVTGF